MTSLWVGAWHWTPIEDFMGLVIDEPAGEWFACADGGEHGTLNFTASHVERKFGRLYLSVQIRWHLQMIFTQTLADGRIDVDRDGERRGLTISAHEQLRRLDVPITLAELRALLDAFIHDALLEVAQMAVPDAMSHGPPSLAVFEPRGYVIPLAIGEDGRETGPTHRNDRADTVPETGEGLPV
jgi:hypothetical protein